MLFCLTLFAIFASSPCSARPTATPSENYISNNDSDARVNINQDILAILNSANDPNNDESNLENESLNENLPQITIWQFPTERRVFIGDIEVFVNSTEDEDYSHEVIDPQKAFVHHPHKHHGSHKEFSDEEQLPAFKRKSKRNNDEEIELSELIKSINGELDEAIKYLPKLNADPRDVMEKNGIDLFNTKEIIPGIPTDRQRREWEISDYLQWLLSGFNEPTTTKSYVENQNKEINDNNILSDKNYWIPPVNPDILKISREQFKGERRKRSIDSESNINLLDRNNVEQGHEDDDDVEQDDKQDDEKDDEKAKELFNDFFKVLQSDKELYSILLTVYYFGK